MRLHSIITARLLFVQADGRQRASPCVGNNKSNCTFHILILHISIYGLTEDKNVLEQMHASVDIVVLLENYKTVHVLDTERSCARF